MDTKTILELIGLLSALATAAVAIWRSGRGTQKFEDRIVALELAKAAQEQTISSIPSKAMNELELEKIKSTVAAKVSQDSLSAICAERHKGFDRQIEEIKKSIAGTGVQMSVQAMQSKLDALSQAVQARADSLGKELHDRITREIQARADAVHSLAQDVRVLQNGAAGIAAAKESLESHMFEHLAALKTLETQVASMQKDLDKLDRRLHDTELAVARAGGK